jgi:hypothetical protein
MPGEIPSIGVSMDERIVNLLGSPEERHRVLQADDEELGGVLLDRLRGLDAERERIAESSGRTVARELRSMGEMGISFVDEICRCVPEFPPPVLPRRWDTYLPPLSDAVSGLLERCGTD